MARVKKKEKILMPEEKLQQALVPESEQPYQVPENWRWVTFSSLIVLISGRDAALSDCNDQGDGIPYILGASNLDNNSFSIERWIRVPQVVSLKGDILLSVKGTIGKLYLQNEEAINISRQIMAIRPCFLLNKKYTYYLLMSICEELKNAGNGLIPGISRKDILERPFPLPPPSEQQRIVNRIESLFAKLDEAKEKAQAVVDGFEDRKAAILHKAFTGELTEGWRRKNNLNYNSWVYKRLSECATVVSGYAFSSKDFSSTNDVPCIKITNVGVGEFVAETYEYLPIDYLSSYNKFAVEYGDILISLTRSYISSGLKVCFNSCSKRALLNQRVALIRDCNKPYIYYYLRSEPVLNYVKEKSKTTNQPNLSIKDLCGLIIPLASENEQKEIVRILDYTFERELQVKETTEQVIAQIDTMKKSILARAFRGELGTNDPSDESAEELLKRIL